MNKQGITILALLCIFTCSLSAQTRAEYWLDADPGRGNATAFNVNAEAASVDIPTDALSYGWHIAGIRVQQSRWSQTYTHRFYKAAPKAEPGVLSGAEYWVNTDPGQGQATAVPFTAGQTDFAVDFLTEGLEPGFHIAGLRVRYGKSWSQTYTHRFFIAAPAPAATELTAAEYWIDSDPGRGEALPLAVTAGQSEIALDVLQTDTLTEGYHIVGLRVRYGDVWSQTYTHRFLHTVKHVVETHIEAVGAYWDGNSDQTFAIPFVQVGDSAIIDGYDFDTKDLTYGLHYLYLYAKANGKMSIISRYEVCKNAIPQFSILDEEELCVGDEVIFIDESTEVQTETTYTWDMGDGKTKYTTKDDILHTFTKAGKYTVSLTVKTGDGCESTYAREVYIHTKSAPSVSLSRTKSKICEGESVTFTATPTNGGQHPTYTWYRNGQVITDATEAQLILDDLQNGDKVKVQLTTDNPCAETKTALSSELTQTVNALPVIEFLLAETYYTDDKAFSLTNMATPAGGTFYINDAEAKLFNPKANELGIYTVRYEVTNSNGCKAEAETTFTLKIRDDETGLTDIQSDQLPRKILLNGQIYILRGDKVYTVTGQETTIL